MSLRPFILATLALLPIVEVDAQVERSKRRPDIGGYLRLDVSVLHSTLSIPSGETSGELWFEYIRDDNYHGSTSLTSPGDSEEFGELRFSLDPDSDPIGVADEPPVGAFPERLMARGAASSDVAMAPIRLLIPHKVDWKGKREATKQLSLPGATVDMTETNLGTRRIDGVNHDTFFTHSVRRFLPSQVQIHDFVFTVEATDERFIMGGVALRLIAEGSIATGEKPEDSRVLWVSLIRAEQLNWLRGKEMIDDQQRDWIYKTFVQNAANALFEAMDEEGIGDPFDSPSAFAIEKGGFLDDRSLGRLINIGHPRALARVAPQLIYGEFKYDPATHLKEWRKATHPVEKLLLAAAAAKGGATDPAFARDVKLAALSKDRATLKAARLLAKGLGDHLLANEITKRIQP